MRTRPDDYLIRGQPPQVPGAATPMVALLVIVSTACQGTPLASSPVTDSRSEAATLGASVVDRTGCVR